MARQRGNFRERPHFALMRRLNDAQMIQVEKVSFFMGNEPTAEE